MFLAGSSRSITELGTTADADHDALISSSR